MTDFSVISSLFRYLLEESKKHQRDNPNLYYVTDLTQCSHKRVLSMKFPELSAFMNFEPAVVMGILVHGGLEKILSEMDIKVEVEGQKTVIDTVTETEYIVKGRADAIVEGEDEKICIEIKMSRSANNIPYEHHIDQARIYNWLFDADMAILVYITPTKLVEYGVKNRATDDEILNRITFIRAPRYDWECKYCPFSKICPDSKE